MKYRELIPLDVVLCMSVYVIINYFLPSLILAGKTSAEVEGGQNYVIPLNSLNLRMVKI